MLFIPWRCFCHVRLHTPSLIAIFAVLLLGCTVNPGLANAVTSQPIDQRTSGEFVWHDLFTHDLKSSSQFYEELFGWSFVNSLSGNTKVKRILLGDTHIGNAIEIQPLKTNTSESQWLNYMSVESVDDTLRRIEDFKGKVLIPARDLFQRGRVAVCLDSEKAVFGIIKTQKENPDAQLIELDSWLGSELWTNNMDEAVKFYGNLVGYSIQTTKMKNGETYQIFKSNDQARAGIVKIPFDDVQPNWVPYIAVRDTMAVAEKVLQLGGQFLTEPDRDFPENAAVLISDPSGAVFGIQQVAVESDEGETK